MHEESSGGESLGEFYAAALDSLPISIVVLDSEGIVVETNEAWREFARDNGYEGDVDTIGVDYLAASSVDSNEDAVEAVRGLQAVLDGERDLFTMEYPCHSPTQKRWFLMRASPFSADGDRHLVVAHVEITQRKVARLEAEAKAEELEEKRENLEMLNQVVRHDIRNEMSVVLTWVEMLSEDVPEEDRAGVKYIRDAGEKVIELTETVGDLVAVVTHEDDFPLEPTALAPLVRSEVESLRARSAARDSTVTVTGADDLPDVTVLADDVLSSAFGNVLSNAVLHSETDVRIEISATVREETVVVRIVDDGPGIPDERKEAVFGRGNKGLASDGTGLGLYLVDKTVERYGGDVRIEDNEPSGTVVRFELPLA